MNPMRRLPLLVVLVSLIGCAANAPVAKKREPGQRLDARTIAVLSAPTKVEAFRLDWQDGPTWQTPKLPGQQRLNGYLVTKQGADPGLDFAGRLRDIVFDDSAFGEKLAICYDPGVAFRVWKDDQAVDVVICYLCHNAYIGPPSDAGKENCGISHRRWRDLVELAKQAFPNDADIQELK